MFRWTIHDVDQNGNLHIAVLLFERFQFVGFQLNQFNSFEQDFFSQIPVLTMNVITKNITKIKKSKQTKFKCKNLLGESLANIFQK